MHSRKSFRDAKPSLCTWMNRSRTNRVHDSSVHASVVISNRLTNRAQWGSNEQSSKSPHPWKLSWNVQIVKKGKTISQACFWSGVWFLLAAVDEAQGYSVIPQFSEEYHWFDSERDVTKKSFWQKLRHTCAFSDGLVRGWSVALLSSILFLISSACLACGRTVVSTIEEKRLLTLELTSSLSSSVTILSSGADIFWRNRGGKIRIAALNTK